MQGLPPHRVSTWHNSGGKRMDHEKEGTVYSKQAGGIRIARMTPEEGLFRENAGGSPMPADTFPGMEKETRKQIKISRLP